VSTTLFVSNLPASATEETLTGKFARFGIVVSVTLDRDPDTGVSRRSGSVEMKLAADAQKAVNWLNFADFDGRLISVTKSRFRLANS
jgi:RNA recognition motif-containing protein